MATVHIYFHRTADRAKVTDCGCKDRQKKYDGKSRDLKKKLKKTK